MKISTTITNCKKTAFAFLAVLFCLMINGEKGLGQVYTENFNENWTSTAVQSPAPTVNSWTSNRGATNANAWHRNDYTTNWSSANGSPSANGYTGTAGDYYARFHTYDISNGTSSYINSPSINLSAYSSCTLTFYYINTGGSDVMNLSFSNDGGTTFTSVGNATNQTSWFQYSVTIPAAYLVAGFQIRFNATSDFGASDIGLDQVQITGTLAQPTITNFSPTSGCANATSVTITGTNFTGATGVTFGGTNAASFTVNSSTQITATPAAGTTGVIKVTTPNGIGTSGSNFTVNPLPAAPAAGNASRCGAGTVTITATPGSGETIDWYSAATGGTLLLSANTSYTTPSISATTNYYAQARNTTTGCTSATRTAVTATVNAVPAAPAAGNASRCGAGTVTITSTPGAGETIDWYDASTGGTLLLSGNTSYTTPSISATTTYYAQARNTTTGCISATRTAVTATVNAVPAAPAAGNASRCGAGTVTITSTPGTGETIDWYNAATGGTLLLSANTSYTTPSISATTTYYAQARNTTTGCTSATRTAVTATVNAVPAAPAAGNASRCGAGTVTITATPGSGETIDWYSAATGGTLLLSANTSYTTPSISATTNYYAQARNTTTGCISATRTAVTATVNAVPAAPAAGNASRCGAGTVTITSTPGAGETIDWYDASTGGTLLLSGNTSYTTPSISATTTYYAQARNTTTGCISATRTAVTATVNAVPAAPAAGNASRCGAGTVTITSTPGTGETIDWYSAAIGGTLLLSANTSYTTPSISATTTYYAQARNTTTGCISATRTAVTATVNAVPAAPAAGNASRCGAGTVTITSTPGTGETIDWYDAATGGTLLLSGNTSYTTPSISATTIYYAESRNTTTGCISGARTAVAATVNITAAPTGSTPQIFCASSSPTIADLTATGTTIQWYAAASGGSPLASTTALVDGTDYYATQTDGSTGCESSTRLDVLATVYQPPITTDPGPATQTLCATQNVSYSVTATGTGLTYQWYLGSNPVVNGGRISGATTSTLTITGITAADGGNYTVVVSGTAPCSPATSAIAHLDVNQSIVFSAQPLTPQTICEGTTYTIFAQATGATGVGSTYEWRHNGIFYATGTFDGIDKYTLTITAVTPAEAGSYRLYLDDGSGTTCSKANSNIATLVVNPTPTATISGDATVCQNATAPIITFTNPNALPVTITYNINGTGTPTINVAANSTATVAAPTGIANTFAYNLVSVAYQSGPGCSNPIAGQTATVTVNPTPTVNDKAQTICSGGSFSVTPVDGSGGDVIPAGTTYSWSAPTATGITGAAAGSNQTSISGTLTNTTSSSKNITYVVTPTSGTCAGASFNVTVTVNPKATIAAKTQTICSGSSFSVTPVDGSGGDIVPAGTTYSWSAPTMAAGITGGVAGTGSGITGTLSNSNNTSGTATYTVTPTSGSCTGASFTVTVTVSPQPSIANKTTTTCSGTAFSVTPTNGTDIVPTGTIYSWGIPAVTGGLSGGAAGTNATSITGTLTNPTNTAQTATYTVTPTSGSCTGSTFTVTVTVNPKATIAAKTQTICSGGSFSVSPTNGTDIVPAGTTYSWSAPTVTGGLTGGAAGTNATSISGTLNNPNNTSGTATYTITPTSGTCTGSNFTVTVTVSPQPSVANKTTTTCSGTAFSVTPANGTDIVPTGTTYSWSVPAVTGGLTGGAAGTNATSISGTLTNPTNTAQTATYAVTPTSGSCTGSTFTVTVTVSPKATIAAKTQTICSGGGFSVTPVDGSGGDVIPAGTTYSWSAPTATGITGAAAGSNQTSISGTLTNTTSSSKNITYVVTPTSGTCAGASFNVTVTVNPKATIAAKTQTICSGSSFSVTPVDGSGGDIVPAGTTYSWSAPTMAAGITGGVAGTGSGITGTLSNSNNTSGTATYTVTPTSGSCTGASFTVTVTVSPQPSIANKTTTTCSGTAFSVTPTNGTDIVPTGTIYSWGIPAVTGGLSGGAAGTNATSITGTLTNPTNTAQTATYTVTPTSGSCTGSTFTVTVTVNPKATIAAKTQTICSGGSFSVSPTNGTDIVPAGTTYSWSAPTVTGGLTGGAAGTNATSISGTLNNPNNTSGTATYTITPTSGTCTGSNFTVTVTVSPQPSVANKTTTTCSGTAFSVTPANGTDIVPTGTTYSWSVPAVTGGLTGGAAGTNATSISGTLTNPTNTAQTATYAVTPTSGSCTGSTFTVTVTVSPKATIAAKTQTICSGGGFSVTPVDGSGGDVIPAGTTYSWSAPTATGITGAAAGSNQTSISGTLTNTTSSSKNITYVVTPTSGTCAGASFNVTVTVNPKATIAAKTQTICSGSSFSVTPVDGSGGDIVPAGTTYSWSAPTATGITGAAAGSNQTSISGTLINTTSSAKSITYTVTPTSGSCTGSSFTVTVTVSPVPSIANKTATPTCSGTSFTVTPVDGAGGDIVPSGIRYSWSAPAVTGGMTGGAAASNQTSINGTLNNPTNANQTATYTVTPTSGSCNGSTFTVTVTVYPLPSITPAATAAPVCYSSSAQTSTLSYSNPTSSPTTYSINYNNAANNAGFVDVNNAALPASPITIFIAAGTDPGTYTGKISVTNANGCTSSTTNFTVTINALPTPTLTNSPASPVCANTSVTYTTDAGQSNYVWTFSGTAGTDYTIVSGGNSTSNTAVVTWKTSTPATKTVKINYTNGNGCTAVTPTSNSITVLAVPSGSITVTENSGTAPNDNKICAGDAVTFTAPSGYGSYTWKVNGTIVQGPNTDNTYSTTTLTAGQTVTVDIANASNCGSTFTAPTVTVNPLPTNPALIANPSTPTCPGTNVIFTASPTGTGYTFTFKLNGSSVQSGASNTYSSTTLNNGDQVTVDVTNNNGCTATSSPVTVAVSTLPSGTLSVSPGNSFCIGTSVTFTATSGFSNYNFKINGTTAPGGNGSPNTYTTTALTNGQVVTVDVTNSTGCIKTFNPISVTVNPLPTGTLTATENSGVQNDNNICAGSPVTFTFSSSTYSNYNFKVNGTSKQNGSSNSYVNSTLASGDVVTVDVTSGSGCIATFTAPAISVIQPPTGSVTPSTNPICAGNNETFTATAGYTNYNFQVNGTTVQNGNSNTYSTTTLAPGDAVTVDVTGSNGCISTFTATVTINPTPTGTLAIAENSGTPNDGIICTGTSVTFTAPNGFTNYNFLLNGASIQNGASKTYTTTTLADNDKVTVAVTGAGGCIGLLNQYTITVNPLPVVAPITTTAPSFDVCVGSAITLQDATSAGMWSSESPGIATVNASTGVVTGVAAGTAVIDYTYTNSNGCSTTVTATVTVHALPIVQPITGNFNICTGAAAGSQLSDNTIGGTWSSDNTGVATVDNTGLVHGISQGTATISYTVTDANGCSTTVTATVTVSDFPSVAHITTTSPSGFNVCLGNTIQLNDVTSGGTWSEVDSTGTGTINSGGVLTGKTAGIVIVYYSISSSCGLPAYDTVHVNVNTPPSTTISYAGGPFCTTSGPVSVAQTGTTGGTYSSTSGLTINGASGMITPASSTAGTYTVTYTIPASATGGCGVYTTTTSVVITAAPTITSFSYSGTPYCSTVTSASPTLTATSNSGTYSYTVVSGGPTLSLNTTSGVINPSTSSAGTYNIIYTIAASGGCAAVNKTTSVTINTAPSATISYTGGPFCTTLTNANVTRTGTAGGTYSSTTGLTINSTTGAINPSSSTAGTYTVTYTINASGGCSLYTATTSVIINAAPTAVAGTAVKTCSNNPPVNITAGSSATNYSTIIWTSTGTGTFTNANSLTAATYTPSAADISAGSVTLTLTANGSSGCAAAVSTKILTISPPPPAFVITPSGTLNVCQGDVQPLTATVNATTTGSVTVSSGNINLNIPDAQNFFFFVIPGSVTNNLNVSTVPAGAVINSMSVNFNITHTYDNDLVLNVKAPNGKVLNLVDQKGADGDNFTNTVVSSTGSTVFTNVASAAPFTGTYASDADNGVGTPNSGNTVFSDLFSTPNGTWTFGAEDDGPQDVGKIVNWSITFNYTIPGTPLAATWSPTANLYTDAGATSAYTGTPLSTVYAKPSSTGNKVYTATISNAAGCSTSQNVTLNVGAVPAVTITADYCAVAGKVQLTANSAPAATSYLWSTGATTQTILVDVSGIYSVTVYAAGTTCPGKGTINVANELIYNGNFELGNVGFTSSYPYRTGAGSLNNPPGYAVDTAANYYGPTFLWGKDHTTGHGKFMMVNGAAGANYQIWQQTISVLPNTTYYFSAWGLELDNLPSPPTPANAQLQFNVNGTQTGTLGNLPRPPANTNNDTTNHQWVRFYGSWTSGPTTTSAVVSITDLQGAVYGNNFGLDDISFGTLSTFVNLVSATGTDAQTVCVNNPITNIVYSAGSSASAPTITGLPTGVTSSWNGVYLTISGTPTVAGNYSYTVTTTGSCQPATATGTITVQAQKIALTSGSASPSVCANAAMPNIVFTLSGTATGASTIGLPAGVTGLVSGSGPTYTYTISGTPTAVAGSYPYTITTLGSCMPVTFNGTITITSQTITLNTANNTQTVCISSPIANIQYTVGGTGTGATISWSPSVPPGVTGNYSGGLFVISGTPTSAAGSPYTYTVTTSGSSCAVAMATGTITVTPAASFTLTSGAATNPQTVCKGTGIIPVTYMVNNGTGASATGLPAGVNGNYATGVFTISGTPTAAVVPGTYNYTVTSSGGCAVGTTTGSITVQAQTISLSSGARSPSVCANTSMSNIVFTIGGTATGATVSGVPTGVTGTLSGTTFTIGGTPTGASGTYHYTVTTSGSSCSAVTDTGTITISAAAVGGTIASVSICSGSSGILTLTGQTGAVTRWEVSTDFGTTWTQIANTTISQNFSNVMTTTMYRVLVSGCGTVYSSVATVGVHNLWTGRTSTDWNVTSNWSDNLLPSASCTTVMIPAGTPNKPQLTSNATVPNLTIAPNTNLDLNGSTLTINGVFTGSTTGYLIGSNTSGVIIGGSATSLYFDQTTPSSTNVLKTLTVNNGGSATLGNALNITAGSVPGVLIANGTLNAAGNLTLKSDYSGTASVGPSSGTISGNVSVERFIPPLRAWRFLTTPTNSMQSINQAWQEGATPNPTVSMRTNPNPGYGTEITYDNLTAHGYDVNTTYNASIKYWDSAANGWNTPPNTYVALRSHDAYCLFVRGSRAVDLSLAVSAPPDLTILRAYGTLNQTNGNPVIRSITGVAAGGGLFVGNPYASSIDITTLIGSGRVTGVNPNQFSVWDPKRSGAGTSNVGGYVDYSAGMIAPNGSPSYPTAASATIIESGEGFFIPLKTGSTSASAQFQETDKSSTQAPVFGRQLPEQSPSGIYANLMVPTAKGLFLVDGVASGFGKNYNADVDQMDFRKNPNFDENMMLVRNNNFLSIEFRPVPVITDTLFYKLYIRQQPYVLQVFSQNMSSIPGQAWLVDKYLNTKTAVNLGDTLLYSFTPNTDLASYRDRFMLVFKRTIKATPVATTMSSGGATAATLEGKVDVYPNPVITGSKVLLKFSSMRAGNYEITLSSLEGTVLTKKSVEHEGGNYNYDLQLDARWATGNYLITITGKNGYNITAKLVIGK